MKLVIGLAISFCIGAMCRYFDIPVPSPPLIPGALLVLAMTLGYTASDRILVAKHPVATAQSSSKAPGRRPLRPHPQPASSETDDATTLRETP